MLWHGCVFFLDPLCRLRLRVPGRRACEGERNGKPLPFGWCSMDLRTWASTDGDGFPEEDNLSIVAAPEQCSGMSFSLRGEFFCKARASNANNKHRISLRVRCPSLALLILLFQNSLRCTFRSLLAFGLELGYVCKHCSRFFHTVAAV